MTCVGRRSSSVAKDAVRPRKIKSFSFIRRSVGRPDVRERVHWRKTPHDVSVATNRWRRRVFRKATGARPTDAFSARRRTVRARQQYENKIIRRFTTTVHVHNATPQATAAVCGRVENVVPTVARCRIA